MKHERFLISRLGPSHHRGVTLLEVMLAVAVFAFGMLALANLQGNLTRSSSDSNSRTVAVLIAEEIIERARSWQQIDSDPDNPSNLKTRVYAFNDLSGIMEVSITRGGLDYAVRAEIHDYYFDPGRDTFTETPSGNVAFKTMAITVSWVSAGFMSGEGTVVGDLGSGTIRLMDIIHSLPSFASGRVVADDDGAPQKPEINYAPGSSPDVIALQLSDTTFRESSSPMPEVITSGELSETWFDVVTYNSASLFLRREEFVALSCQCTLRAAGGSGKDGLRPTVWTGTEYSEEELVGKWWGQSASRLQSLYCDVCCRDHHDGPASTAPHLMYDSTSTAYGVNHAHFGRDRRGNLVLADSDGHLYLEACRLVRKDGFFRAVQDFRLEGYNAFPENYLDSTSGSSTYSGYVVDAVTDYYANDRTALTQPESMEPAVDFPGNAADDTTTLPTALNSSSQQLRSRGIYLDYVGPTAAGIIDCMAPVELGGQGNSGDDCGAPDASSWLEIYPFLDVQLTFLGFWNENSGGDPVTVTNEPVVTGSTHSRALAALANTSTTAQVMVESEIHKRNVGLTATSPINPDHNSNLAEYDIYVDANGEGGAPSPPSGWMISGTINSTWGGVNTANVSVTGSAEVYCGRDQTSFTCIENEGAAATQTITFGNYYVNADNTLWACSSSPLLSNPVYVFGVDSSTTFELPGNQDISGVVITIQRTACPE